MKRNAIVRIVLWGTVLLVLLAILFILIYVPGADRPFRDEMPAATMVPVPLPRIASAKSANAIVTGNQNVYSSPDPDADVVAYAERGILLEILRQEQIGGMQWGYIGAPTLGWIDMKYVEFIERPEPETEGNQDNMVTSPAQDNQYNAVVTADALNVRTAPSSEAENVGMLKKDDSLVITRQELVDGITWGYTPAPVNGWVVMEYVELLEPVDTEITIPETTAAQEPEMTGYGVALDAASIRNMEIEWAVGSILIQPMDITEIRISEEGPKQDEEPMVWKVREGKLAIQYSEKTDHIFGIGLNLGSKSKDLIIQVPLDWQCDSLEIDAASASLEVNDLTIREMEFDGASGTCVFDNCTVEKLNVDTASGDVRFRGSLQQLDCDAASANIFLELTNVPRSIDLDTASGDLDVTLPADAGFTVTMDTMSGDFESDFATTSRNGSHIAGNGRCRIDVDAMSGDVTVRKGA